MFVVKVGGAEGNGIDNVLIDLAPRRDYVLVHGGSNEVDRLAEALGRPIRWLTSPSGIVSRYTDRETMEVFTMALTGKLNTAIVARLQSLGAPAVGLSGVDGGLLTGRRRGGAGGRRAARRHRLFPATGSRRTGPRRHGDGDLVSAAAARAVEFASSPKREPTFVRGSMATLWDDAGREYIDCGASFGVGNLGHCNPAIVEAITRQAQELIHVGPSFGTDAKAAFVEKLLSVAPSNLNRVFLSNSGSEAVEAAIKFARAATGRTKIVAAMRGFHGRTMGALSATWRREFREPFEPLVPGFQHVPFNDVEALGKAVDGDTAAVILEAVQGEGGVHVASPEYLPAAREACDRAGALLIIDEVQTGMGRTGRLFAVERWNVEPDLLTLAKSLAGGVPIGATLATEEVERAFKGSHTSTFGGNPLACAAGTAAIEYTIREKLPERAERLGLIGVDAIRGFDSPSVREVRGLGLMIGVELRGKAAPVLQALQDDGVLAIGAGSGVVRLLPPLVITDEQWSRSLDALGRALPHG